MFCSVRRRMISDRTSDVMHLAEIYFVITIQSFGQSSIREVCGSETGEENVTNAHAGCLDVTFCTGNITEGSFEAVKR